MHIFLILFLFLGSIVHAALISESPEGKIIASVDKFSIDNPSFV